jgi:hypothetical protein
MDITGFSESIWKRGWRDTSAAMHSAWFWAVEIIGTAMIGIFTSDPLILAVCLIGGFALLWLGATAGAPFRQRGEARSALQTALVDAAQIREEKDKYQEDVKALERHIRLAGLSPPRDYVQAVASVSVNGVIKIIDSEGIISITDNGTGDFSFNLEDQIYPERSRVFALRDTPSFKVISVTVDSFRIRFEKYDNGEPRVFGVILEAPKVFEGILNDDPQESP